jgi:hypothetical protein
MKQLTKNRITIAAIAIILGGCAFVSLDSAARRVSIIPTEKSSLLSQCKFLGNTTVSLWGKADTFQSNDTVEKQLNTLARNEAAKIGGDAVIANSDINGNKRDYKVYDCNTK